MCKMHEVSERKKWSDEKKTTNRSEHVFILLKTRIQGQPLTTENERRKRVEVDASLLQKKLQQNWRRLTKRYHWCNNSNHYNCNKDAIEHSDQQQRQQIMTFNSFISNSIRQQATCTWLSLMRKIAIHCTHLWVSCVVRVERLNIVDELCKFIGTGSRQLDGMCTVFTRFNRIHWKKKSNQYNITNFIQCAVQWYLWE